MKKKDISNFILKLERNSDSHKYDYGHTMVIAGSKCMPGAGALCCLGALRSGTGLVTYAVKNDFLNQACSISRPEVMFFVYETVSEILNFINYKNVSSIVIGPGLKVECDDVLRNFIKEIICNINLPVILDASGVTCFKGALSEFNKNVQANIVITPHIGEFSKLLNIDIPKIKCEKEKIVMNFAKKKSVICVLKCNNTVVSSGEKTYINNTGTPFMATAGSGDVLSGIISSFVNIIDDTFEAVKFAVFIHGLTGELLEKKKYATGTIASDIAEYFCYTIEYLKRREKISLQHIQNRVM
ncbi:MAG: NAD(P)H-hydrate dehydratase [Endomicrobium sp.]|jgi:NAD(P)H-hydrate epimerase|nr:NAD(P)H-hydrate dehydratase [Endomicrobium sp.]